ncbi:MAG: hypothetical protein QW057_09935, partial [Candidatus Bathyarchaeia archaeon]
SLVLYRMMAEKRTLAYRAVKENVLSITSDLDRALAHALSLASEEYYATGSRESARAQGCAFLSTWARSVLLAYSNLGLEMGIEPLEEGYTDVAFVFDWNEGMGISYVSARFRLNVTGCGFTGWVGDRVKAARLTLDVSSITGNSTTGSSTLSFTVTREMNNVVPGLSADDVSIMVHVSGSLWLPARNAVLEYSGGGNYTVTFTPRVNESSRGVILVVVTPDDRIAVGARHQSGEFATVSLRSLEANGATQDNGAIQLGDYIFSPLPNMAMVYPGQYISRYFPSDGYRFLNWTTSGNVSVYNVTSPVTGVTVNGDGGLTAFYALGGDAGEETNGSATVMLESVELASVSSNLGWINLDGTNHLLPNATVQPLGFHHVAYTPFDGNHLFLRWDALGEVFVENGTSSSTSVLVNGNGTLRAVYLYMGGAASPQNSSYPWDVLCVENDYALVPVYMWSGDDGKLSPTFSTGNDRQAANISSPDTPSLRIASLVNVTCVVRPNPPSRAKDVTLQLGFISNGIYYLLGRETFPVAAEGAYRMPLNTASGQFPGETGVIPENSTIILTIEVSFRPGGWGTFFLYHGTTWPSSIELGGRPLGG